MTSESNVKANVDGYFTKNALRMKALTTHLFVPIVSIVSAISLLYSLNHPYPIVLFR